MQLITSSKYRRLHLVLIACFVLASLLFFLRAVEGSGPAKSIVNIGSAVAVLFMACVMLSTVKADTSQVKAGSHGAVFFLILTIIPFLITLHAPLLFDAYSHVVKASQETLGQVSQTFYRHPKSGDFFFRPLGYLDYWAEAHWAGLSFTGWNWDGAALHIAATMLVHTLCRSLRLSGLACAFAALLCGLHGSNPEVVSWTAARFDELTTVFTLITLICLCRFLDSGTVFFGMLIGCICAQLSKEAAFCLSGLAVCVIIFRGRFDNRGLRAVLALLVLSVGVLIFRFWVLGGVGGYSDSAGTPTVLHFSYLHFFELLSFRMWPILLLPINWSLPMEWWLSIGILLFIGGSIAIMLASRPSSRRFWSAACFCIVALLPASHLALLDSRLIGSRVYHLALIGFALLIGALFEGFLNRRIATLAIGALVLFQMAALTHNLLIWRDTAQLAGQVCRTFPDLLAGATTAVVSRLPTAYNGVFFLANGFSDCVFVNSGKRIHVDSSNQPPGSAEPAFHWDEVSKSVTKEK